VIAADTSSIVACLSGAAEHDVEVMEAALEDRQLCLPPVVLTELLSGSLAAALKSPRAFGRYRCSA
jgi:predicted nucleic acid-binding protein